VDAMVSPYSFFHSSCRNSAMRHRVRKCGYWVNFTSGGRKGAPSGLIFKSSSGRCNACNFSGSMSRRCNHVSYLDAGGFLTKV